MQRAEEGRQQVLPARDGSRRRTAICCRDTGDTPFFHHVAALVELARGGAKSGELYTHHFNMLRAIMEKTASFHRLRATLPSASSATTTTRTAMLHKRLINLLSHGNYSLYEPREMLEENKSYFRKIFSEFIEPLSVQPGTVLAASRQRRRAARRP